MVANDPLPEFNLEGCPSQMTLLQPHSCGVTGYALTSAVLHTIVHAGAGGDVGQEIDWA
jgi:hypothetical protein